MRKINVGLIGLGNVGSELYKMLLAESQRFNVLKVAVKDKNKKRKVNIGPELLDEDAGAMVCNPDFDVILDASNDAPENILERIVCKKNCVPQVAHKHYVLASKKTMAFYGGKILKFAKENNVEIGFEATVCAGIPIVRLLREGHIPEKIIEVGGILNGTTNYILTKMHEGKNYDDALYEAQRLGFAEADPTEDVSGLDSACKLIILSGLCFGRWIEMKNVDICGIDNFPQKAIENEKKSGNVYRLEASAVFLRGNRLKLKVEPRICGDKNELARKLKVTEGVENLVYVKTEYRRFYFSGPGAGGKVTAAAMMSDLNYIADKRGLNAD